MDFLKKNFDDFNIQARIIPALIIALPLYVYVLITGIINFNFIELMKKSIFSVLIISIYYKVIRNLGKRYEKKLYAKLGAKPTTIVLRYSDNNFDDITKTRYHKKLNKKVSGVKLPIEKEKETLESDKEYESAINWLRNYANSNRESEYRVYQELKDYNFWRNLYGGKWIVVNSCVIFIIIELLKKNYNNIIILSMVFIGIFACTAITERTVKEKAFDYAKTLLEVCEKL